MPTSLDPKSVLIVEDDWRLSGEWRRALEASGLRVAVEADAEQAICLLRQESFDVVVVDLMLRDRDGQITREGSLMLLASIGLNAYLAPKVLAVSGYEETTELYQSYGILTPASTLLKPFSISEMLERVLELVDQRAGELEASHMAQANQRWAVQRFKFATDHSQDAIYWVREDGSFFYANDTACRMLGYSREELLNLRVSDIDPEYPDDVWAAHWQRMRRDRLIQLEPTHIDADGRRISTHMDVYYYNFEGDEFIIATCRDITERVELENQLRFDSHEMQIILDSLPALVFVKDTANNILRVNQVVVDSLGVPRSEIEGSPTEQFYPNDAEGYYQDDLAVIESGTPKLGYLEPQRDRWIRTDKIPIANSDNVVDKIICVVSDVTESLQMEKDLLFTKRAVELSSDAVFYIRADGSFSYANKMAASYLGYSQEELCQMSVADIDPEHPAESWPTLWRQLQEHGSLDFVSTHLRKDGSRYQCDITANFVVSNDEELVFANVRDITARLEAEHKLNLTQQTVDLSADAIFFIRKDGTFSYANEQASEYLGYSREELCQMSVSDINPDYPAEMWPEHWEETRKARVLTFQSRHVRKDGSSYDCELRKIFMEFDGEPLIVGLVRDITERRNIEKQRQELLASNQSMIDLLSHSDGVWDWEVRSNTVSYAPGWRKMLGFDPDDTIGFPDTLEAFDSRIHPQEREGLWEAANRAISRENSINTRPFIYEFRLRNKQQNYIWVRSRAMPSFDEAGDAIRLVGSTYDITEVREAQLKLEQSQKRLKQLADINTPCWICERDSNCSWLNGQWLQYTGKPLEAQIGFGWVEVIHPDDVEATKATYQSAVDAQTDFELEYRLRRHDGIYRLHRAVGRVQRDHHGEFDGFIGFSVDIHDLREAQNALVAETEQLAKANQELEQFSYVASHDLKAPLRAIGSIANWLREDLAGQLPEKSERHLTQLRERADRMDSLLNDLLEYSRAGRQQEKVNAIDLQEVVDNSIALLNIPSAFVIETHLEVGKLRGHLVALETVIRNLIGNAVKHHDGQQGTVEVSAHADGPFINIAVTDDGPGIAADMHDKALAMFQTLKPRDEVEGSGMGLAIVKRLVESENGRIWIEDNKPRGTRVCFTWPREVS